jgi:hypothetical protein
MDADGKKDFFISYNQADEDVAQWIAWTLEDNGYSVLIEAWDFRAGGNFVVEMDRGLDQCERMIAVVSPHYLSANYTVPEWPQKFAEDPQGLRRTVVPVIVAPCEPAGLLQQLIRIDLTGLDRDAAKKELLAKLMPGRAKPATEPPFPDRITNARPSERSVPEQPAELQWQPLSNAAEVRWRSEQTRARYSYSTLEVHTITIDATALESRVLRELPEPLSVVGRQAGLFEQSEGLHPSTTEDSVTVTTADQYGSLGARGITVFKDRELVSWTTLPHDQLGSIFDEDDVKNRIAALLALHVKTGLLVSDRVAFGVSIEPISSLMVGSAGDIQKRSSAQFLFSMSSGSSLRLEPAETAYTQTLATALDQIAEELTAKLVLRIESLR